MRKSPFERGGDQKGSLTVGVPYLLSSNVSIEAEVERAVPLLTPSDLFLGPKDEYGRKPDQMQRRVGESSGVPDEGANVGRLER